MNRGVEIKLNVRLYLTRSYVMAVFLCISMFNPMTAFSADIFKNPEFDTIIMRKDVKLGLCGHHAKSI